jgi:hypothetical protein
VGKGVAAVLVAGWFAAVAAAEPPAAYQPDWNALAKHYVHDSLKLAPGERVLIHYDPSHSAALVDGLRTEITRSGGIVTAELTWPSKAVGAYLESLSAAEKEKRAAAEDSVYRELFARSDVYLWIDASNYEDLVWRRFEHLIGESKVRAIHSHWFEPPDPAERDAVVRMYERAILLPPSAIESRLAPLEAALRGTNVHLTSPAGTNLSFAIPHDAWFHRNTGEASRAKTANARSVRDREEELPGGVLRTVDVTSVEGTLVANIFSGSSMDAVTLTFREGRVVKVAGGTEAGQAFAKWFDAVTGDKDRVSELVIGTNPELQPIQPSGFMPYYGYGAGIVRIAVGDNWESGGPLRTSDHRDWWLFVTDGTLTAGGRDLIRNGSLQSN